MTSPRSRGSTLTRWLIALLLLAALAWGLGEMRSDRGPKPEMGVGDLRTEEPAAVEQRASETGAGPRPRPEAGNRGTGVAPDDGAGGDPGDGEADR